MLAVRSLVVIIAISLMKSAMELEDAEQTYFSQWLRLGYDDQPPLFTGLHYTITHVLGITIVSYAILRALFIAILRIVCKVEH